jgi:hypothetical protein
MDVDVEVFDELVEDDAFAASRGVGIVYRSLADVSLA